MRIVALRFAENFAPDCGAIAAHQELIDAIGHVWYGKIGSAVSSKTAGEILENGDPRILLIHSGGQGRWWAHIEKIQRETPTLEEIPAHYRDRASDLPVQCERYCHLGDLFLPEAVASQIRKLSQVMALCLWAKAQRSRYNGFVSCGIGNQC